MLKFFWLGFAAVLLVIEGLAPGLVCLWFALGALAAFVACLCGTSLLVQVLTFFISSLLSLLCLRSLAAKYIGSKKVVATNADSVIGKECIVLMEINNINGCGQVKVSGSVWSAKSMRDDVTIPAGEKVIARRIEGVKLIVEPEKKMEVVVDE